MTSSLLAATAVGASIAVTPFITEYPVYAGQAARYAIAAVVLFAVLPRLDPLRARGRLTRRQVLRLAGAAATGSAGFNVLLVAASRHADPAAIGAVVGASPVVLAVLGAPRNGGRLPRPRPAVVGGAVLASAAVLVMHGSGRSTLLGLLLATAVLVCEVGFTLVAAPVLTAVGPARVSAWNCALAAGMLAAASFVTGESLRFPTAREGSTLLYQSIIMTAVAFVLWYRGVERLGPDRAGVTMAMAPVASAGVAALVGTGTLTPATALGTALVACGVVIAVRARSSHDRTPDEDGAAAPDQSARPAGAHAGRSV
jgi:drug/metabolite transporter (DMT)-like permease